MGSLNQLNLQLLDRYGSAHLCQLQGNCTKYGIAVGNEHVAVMSWRKPEDRCIVQAVVLRYLTRCNIGNAGVHFQFRCCLHVNR